ncbi:MAG: hypothetical protein A3J38_06185 [Gammaproteobacteria bacterium RIFCSPHIGHO2_12_FULL_45_9]|nr:MAG: hypothetical protein A3J38_06185 [Gammaproteobacteria bacterium RIFCSPHIGHO2_12_FULL_45_9]
MAEHNVKFQEIDFQLNEFYRDAYRRTMKLLSFFIVTAFFLAMGLTWMAIERPQPPYYAAVVTGEIIPMHALSEPVVTNDFIARWSALAVRLVYNLSFEAYEKQLAQAQPNFTSQGWAALMSAFKSAGFLNEIVEKHLIVSAVVSNTPVILAPLVLHGKYTWRVQMPLLVTFTSASEQRKQRVMVTITVERVPTKDAAQGIQISDFSAGYS